MSQAYICRLFRADQPFQHIEARTVPDGELTIGRDPSADWPLPDPDGTLSRIHCHLTLEDGRLTLTDRSTNGTYLDNGERAPRGKPVGLEARSSFRLGALSILVDRAEPAVSNLMATMVQQPVPPVPLPSPAHRTEGPAKAPAFRDASLLEAFCEGASLDASAFSSEDPVALMRRVGEVYQQTILGLSTLMAERARIKGEHPLERTTIGAAHNNPFKWAPSRKLAQDLLRTQGASFLSDGEAVRASFEDIARHMAAMVDGANAVANHAMEALSPKKIEEEAKSQSSLLRNQATVCWDILLRRYTALTGAGEQEGSLQSAFSSAYARATAAPTS